MCTNMVEPKRLERLSPACKTGALPIELWPRYCWMLQELHLQSLKGLQDYSPQGSPHCPTHPLLAGRVGLEPTSISLTGRPPTNSAPAKYWRNGNDSNVHRPGLQPGALPIGATVACFDCSTWEVARTGFTPPIP